MRKIFGMWTAAGSKKDWPIAGNEASCLLGGSGVSAFAEGRRVKSAHYYRILASPILPVIMYLFKQAAGDHFPLPFHGSRITCILEVDNDAQFTTGFHEAWTA